MGRREVKRSAFVVVGLGIAVLVVLLIASSGSNYLRVFGGGPSYTHELQITAPSAYEAIPGERVTVAGLTAGEIVSTNVTNTGQAHLVIGIQDRYWPVPSDSVLNLREGGTIKATDRYISITPGKSHTDFAEDATVPVNQFIVPVEYDQLFDIFNAKTRTGLQDLFANGGADLKAASPDIRSAIAAAPAPVGEVDAVFKDLGYNQQALSTLISSTATVSDAVEASNPGLQTLLSGAASTFSNVASQSTQLKSTLTSLGPALEVGSHFADHFAKTLPNIATLTGRLHSGLTQIQRIATPLNTTLKTLVDVEPAAVSTLNTIKSNGPQIESLVTKASTTLLPRLTKLGNEGSQVLDCVRPFTPDIVGFLQNWGSFLSSGINNPKLNLLHLGVSFEPWANQNDLSMSQLMSTFPGLKDNFPQAPGTAFNQPWYQPQCGITASSSTNPANDSLSGTYDPLGTKLINYSSTTPVYSTTTVPDADGTP